MAEVTLTNLIKRYGDFVAVDGIDLQIHDRELLVLVGPSGCGKTTTLRMIAGLEEISGGEIRIGKRVVNHVAPKDRNIAMVFQNYALYPHMNVFKNMAFGLKMRRTPKTEIDQRVRATAALLGIEDLLHRKPAQLSGGQRQRVAVGRAIVREPDVFLFDEPLSNLDAKLRVTTRTELVKLQRKLATTMIHVTHDQVEAMMMGDRIVVMNQGKIQQVGTPTEVYNRPVNRFVAEFIGSPPMNFFQGTLVHRDDGLWFQSEFFAVPLEHAGVDEPKTRQLEGNAEQQVVFGVRPEHVVHRSEDEPGTNGAMRAEVEVVQALGSETLLDLKIADQEFTARFPANVSIRAGDRINVCFESSKCHLFDSGSGQALSG